MHIFIDEAGAFLRGKRDSSIAAVGALVIADARLRHVERKYAELRKRLPQENGEVKGRRLDEADVQHVVSLLLSEDALFELTAIDLTHEVDADLEHHQRTQAEFMTKNITPEHHPDVVASIHEYRRRLEAMPLQLYIQTVATFALLPRVFEHATIYYSQRRPPELGAFHWVIDGKEKNIVTNWEDWWYQIVGFHMTGPNRPSMVHLTEGDYSHFTRFEAEIPDFYEQFRPNPEVGQIGETGIDMRKVLHESFRFSSHAEPGLELVDVLTSATRRALSGTLQIGGWRNIPRLITSYKNKPCIQMMTLGPTRQVEPIPYGKVLAHFARSQKPMFPKN